MDVDSTIDAVNSANEGKKEACQQLKKHIVEQFEKDAITCGEDGTVVYRRDSFERSLAYKFLLIDVKNFLSRISEGITVSIISVDIWALTTLITFRSHTRVIPPYAYPLIGIFVHFLLVSLVIAFDKLLYWGEPVRLTLVSATAFFAICVGWIVRREMWRRYETVIEDEIGTRD